MTVFLCKTEPEEYSYDDLVRDGRAPWDGVANPAAQKVMRTMRANDRALIYHTGKEKRIAGLARVVKGAYPDPDHPGRTAAGEPKRVLVDVEPVERASRDVRLSDLKADSRFKDFDLVRIPRMSVMAVPDDLVSVLLDLAGLPQR